MTGLRPQFDRVPAIAEPPFDPTSLLIDDRTGWRTSPAGGLDDVEISPCDGSLGLALSPAARRQFVESSGSFGGLVPPANVAVAPDGSVLLLDRRTRRLRRFDPCCCEFVDLPCTAGGKPGGGARQLRHPGGIVVCRDRLYVCDTGRDGRLVNSTDSARNALRARVRAQNHRVSVFLLPGLELVGHLRPSQNDYPQWRPVDVTCDAHGCVWVVDALNGVVHRFAKGGRSSAVIANLGAPQFVAIDRTGLVYVIDVSLQDGTKQVRVFDRDGIEQPAPASVETTPLSFAPLPFSVNANGSIDLSSQCQLPCPPGSTTFGPSGEPVDPPAPIAAPLVTSGTYLSSALDSRTHECQWHRVILQGDIPAASRVRVETFTSDEDYDADQIASLATWARGEITPSVGDRPLQHDCLVLSPPGRYLWLRLTLIANGDVTPTVRTIEIEFPRLSSLRYLPAVFASEPASADFTARFLSLFDTTVRGIERTVDTEARLFDPTSSPAQRVGAAQIDFLTWLASWIGVTFERGWSEARRRAFLAGAGRLFARRGTVDGLRQQLLQVLGWEPAPACGCAAKADLKARLYDGSRPPRPTCGCRPLNCAPPPDVPVYQTPPLILEHFRLRRWLLLGTARLGAQAVLWGQRIVNRTQLDANGQVGRTRLLMTPDPRRDPLHVFAHRFTVFVPACVGRSDSGRKWIQNLLKRESPAHTQWEIAYVEPRFRIGVQSMIGFDAVVGGVPAEARLGTTALGVASLIGGRRTSSGRTPLRVGRTGRVGTGSHLN